MKKSTMLLFGFVVWVIEAAAQSAGPTPPQLSPQAAYEEAVRPVEIVHRSVTNWSDAELGSLAVAIGNAARECGARNPETFVGEDLVALARLCSLGQMWEPMRVAAARYIDLPAPAKPQLALAYGIELDATLRSNDLVAILKVTRAMLAAVPYDAVVDAATADALSYLTVTYTTVAREVHRAREPILLAALASEHPTLPRHVLYADGLAMAALEQYLDDPKEAARTVAELDEALARWPLAPDDALPIADARRQYALLGKPLPKIAFTLSLSDPRETPHINPDFGRATALLLFPDWCAQCIRMGPELGKVVSRLGSTETRVYALLAEPTPDRRLFTPPPARPPVRPKPATPDAPATPKTAAELMLHTPTQVVPPETLATFAATDFPFLIVVDHAGIVRFMGVLPEAGLGPGASLDTVVEDVAARWPKVPPSGLAP